jgi:hypothetical protein
MPTPALTLPRSSPTLAAPRSSIVLLPALIPKAPGRFSQQTGRWLDLSRCLLAVRPWSKLSARIKGWHTLIVADVIGAVDLRPLVRVFVNGDEAAVGAVMTALALGFALLRMITTGPVGERETR